MSEQARTATELLDRAGGPKYADVTPAQLEQFLARGELGKVVDDQVIVSDRARALLEMLQPEYRGDAIRRATRLA